MPLTGRQRWELVLVGLLAAVVMAAALAAGRFDLVSGNRAGTMYDKRYKEAQVRVSADERLDGDWALTPQGLSLRPGTSGSITIRFRNDHEGRPVIFLYGRTAPGFHLLLSASADGRVFREVARDVSLAGGRVDLTPAVGEREMVWVELRGSTASGDPAGQSALLSRVRAVVLKPPMRVPNLPIASLLILTPLLAYVTRASIRPRGAWLFSLAVLTGLAVLTEVVASTRAIETLPWWEQVTASQERGVYLVLPYVLLLGLLGWHGRVGLGSSPQEPTWALFALAGTLVWGASSRLGALTEMAWTRLDPDVIGYVELAQQMRSPYDTGAREPLWVWMIHGWSWLAGDSTVRLRLLTILLSLGLLVVAYKLFRDYTGRPLVGVLVAGLLGANPYLISLSVRGLREEAYLLAVLCFVYCLFVRAERFTAGWQAAGLAVSGAALHLLRFNSYAFVVPLLAFWAWRQGREKWKLVALPLTFIIALSIPHLVHNARQFGDPLYSMNVHFVWLRNVEFVALKEIGCAGCPTREEMEVNSTLGPSLGAFDYLFGLHSVREVVTGMAQGYVDMYLSRTYLFEIQTGTQSRLGYALYLLGLGLALFGPYRELLAVMVLLASAVPFAMSLGIDPRLGVQTIPVATFLLAYGIWWVYAQTVRLGMEAGRSAWAVRLLRDLGVRRVGRAGVRP